MKVFVLGKEHISGTSRKTGKAFDSNIVHVSYTKNGVEGHTVESIWLDPKSFPLKDIVVGENYSVDRDQRGFVCGFEPESF